MAIVALPSEPLTIAQAVRLLRGFPSSTLARRALCSPHINPDNPRQVHFTLIARTTDIADLKQVIADACHLSPTFGADTTLRVYAGGLPVTQVRLKRTIVGTAEQQELKV